MIWSTCNGFFGVRDALSRSRKYFEPSRKTKFHLSQTSQSVSNSKLGPVSTPSPQVSLELGILAVAAENISSRAVLQNPVCPRIAGFCLDFLSFQSWPVRLEPETLARVHPLPPAEGGGDGHLSFPVNEQDGDEDRDYH